VLARHYVATPGRTSFDTYMTLERTDAPGVIYAEGGAKTVWNRFSEAEIGAAAGLAARADRLSRVPLGRHARQDPFISSRVKVRKVWVRTLPCTPIASPNA